jgi:hypothetical protein
MALGCRLIKQPVWLLQSGAILFALQLLEPTASPCRRTYFKLLSWLPGLVAVAVVEIPTTQVIAEQLVVLVVVLQKVFLT